ncbi:MAG: GNAT family N-acetyltransferase, partial [Clostridia bacterium]|nr:GNAT family N-acetyltransferase [Clostridia bacterium]
MTVRILDLSDLEEVLLMTLEAKATLKARGINQWQSGLPNRESVTADLACGCCFGFISDDGRIAAFTRLSYEPEADYETLLSGAWLTGSDGYATTHRTVVAPEFRSTGLSDRLLEEAARRAKEHGCRSIRVDTHRDNAPMRALITRQGFTECCTFLLSTPDDDPERIGYEK